MRKVGLVIKREFLTRIRSKGFLISTFALPIFMLGIMFFSIFMATRQADHTQKLAILDNAGGLVAGISQGLSHKLPNGQPAFQVTESRELVSPDEETQVRDSYRDKVNKEQLDGYLILPPGVLKDASAEYHTRNAGDFNTMGKIDRAVSDAVIGRRLAAQGVHVDKVGDIVRGIDVKLVKVTKEGETEEKGQTFATGFIMAFLLYMTLIIYGIATMRSVLEEKTTRVIELLVASVRPFQLMAGKILGVASVGFAQYLIWMLCAGLLATYGSAMASAFRPGTELPQFHVPLALLAYVIVFFLGGYFLYASIYAAMGAMVSSEEDAQQLLWPVTLPLVVAFIMFNMILSNPSSTTSVVLSMIPFFSPILMVMRIGVQMPPLWQIALSIALLFLTVFGIVQFSARIYRVGVLMYGKRPSLVEMARWLRYT